MEADRKRRSLGPDPITGPAMVAARPTTRPEATSTAGKPLAGKPTRSTTTRSRGRVILSSEATKAQAPHPHPPKDSDAHPPRPTTRTPRLAALLLSLFHMFAEAVATFPPMPADAGTLLRRPALPQAQSSATGRTCFSRPRLGHTTASTRMTSPPFRPDQVHLANHRTTPSLAFGDAAFRPGLSFLDLLAPTARAHAC
jgi:hypothetical protein